MVIGLLGLHGQSVSQVVESEKDLDGDFVQIHHLHEMEVIVWAKNAKILFVTLADVTQVNQFIYIY